MTFPALALANTKTTKPNIPSDMLMRSMERLDLTLIKVALVNCLENKEKPNYGRAAHDANLTRTIHYTSIISCLLEQLRRISQWMALRSIYTKEIASTCSIHKSCVQTTTAVEENGTGIRMTSWSGESLSLSPSHPPHTHIQTSYLIQRINSARKRELLYYRRWSAASQTISPSSFSQVYHSGPVYLKWMNELVYIT